MSDFPYSPIIAIPMIYWVAIDYDYDSGMTLYRKHILPSEIRKNRMKDTKSFSAIVFVLDSFLVDSEIE